MGRLDDEQIAAASDAFVKSDEALAQRVIAADDQIDALQREIEEKAVTVIARRQPMGRDLREIVGALRIANAARHGTSSSTNPGASCPSDCVTGRTGSNQ